MYNLIKYYNNIKYLNKKTSIIYKYFFLGIHVNVIIFLISFLGSFLLMYRNAAFLLLILYHAAFTECANSKILLWSP